MGRMQSFTRQSRSQALALVILSAVCLVGWAPQLQDPSTSLRLTDTQAAAIKSDSQPKTFGPVVDLVDDATGRQLYENQAYRHHAIGSITKLMTVSLVVRRLKLNRVVTVSPYAASIGGSTMWLQAGDRLAVKALLYGALIPSGNDAAEELAETMGGNDKGFAKIANRAAQQFGLKCSHYVTPHGLDAPGEYSCAADVATMTRLVLSVPLLAHIVSTKQITVYGIVKGESFPLINTNLLLTSYKGAIGVKTGTTDAAGFSVSGAARRRGHVLIAVVLASTPYGRFSDAASLLTFGFRDYVWPTPADTMWSTASLEGPAKSVEGPVPRWEVGWLRVGPKGNVVVPYDPRGRQILAGQ